MIEIKRDKNSIFRFTLKSEEDNPLLNSVDFQSEKEIQKTVDKLNLLIQHSSVFERQTDHNGKFLFKLKDTNGRIIGNCQLYGSEAGMENGIKNLKSRIASLRDSNSL